MSCKSILSGALLAALSTLSAAAVAAPMSLSQEQAVAVAVKQHPAAQAAAHAVEAAEARTSQTETAWIPRLKLEGSYMLIAPVQEMTIDTGLTLPGQTEPVVMEREIGSLHNAAVGLTLGWRAFEFGARAVRTEAAEALTRAAEAEADEQAVEIAFAVRAAYLAARFFHEVETVTSSSLKVAAAEQRDEQVRREAGVGNDLDLARVQMRVAGLDAQLGQARHEKKRALATLRLLMGVPPASQLTLTDDLRTLGAAPLGARARGEQHPSRRRIAALHQATEREHARLGRGYWPTVDVMGSVKLQYPESPFVNDEAGFIYMAGVVLTWNLFDGDLLRRQRNEQEAKLAQLSALGRAADTEIARKQNDAQAQIDTAATGVAAAQRRLGAAEVYQRAAEASLEAGTGTRLELHQATDAVDQARLAVLKAYFDGALGRAAHRRADGKATLSSSPEVTP